MNIALIDTKTHEVKVFDGTGKLNAVNTFSRALDTEEVEDFRKDPKGFLSGVLPAEQPMKA